MPRDSHKNADGREFVDEVPHAATVSIGPKQLSLEEHIRQVIRSEELARVAAAQDMETFEEADDFVVGDDYEPTSPYEMQFDPYDDPYGLSQSEGVEPAEPPAPHKKGAGDSDGEPDGEPDAPAPNPDAVPT